MANNKLERLTEKNLGFDPTQLEPRPDENALHKMLMRAQVPQRVVDTRGHNDFDSICRDTQFDYTIADQGNVLEEGSYTVVARRHQGTRLTEYAVFNGELTAIEDILGVVVNTVPGDWHRLREDGSEGYHI